MRTFITGASSGLGRGLALHYASAGSTVGLCARRADLLAEVARDIEARGARALLYVADVEDTGAMAKNAADFVERAGGADLVVANAGMGIPDGIRKGEAEPIAHLMRVNVIGVTNTVVPFVPTMLAARSGVLAAVSSVAGLRGMPGRAAYSASKAAVITFMEALRMDLQGAGVHAMAICPGFVHTPMTAKLRKMPFVIDADAAVAQMASAIERRDDTFVFPWQVRLLGPVLRHSPEWVVRRFAPPSRAEEGAREELVRTSYSAFTSRPSACSGLTLAVRAATFAFNESSLALVRLASASASVVDVPRPLLKSSRCTR